MIVVYNVTQRAMTVCVHLINQVRCLSLSSMCPGSICYLSNKCTSMYIYVCGGGGCVCVGGGEVGVDVCGGVQKLDGWGIITL